MVFDQGSNSFSEGSYYFLECPRDIFYLGELIGEEFREGRISKDEMLYYETAKVVRRTAKTVTFRVPLLGNDVKIWTKRYNVECSDNEVAYIKQCFSENGLFKGWTTYPLLEIFAYDTCGNNMRLNTGDRKEVLDRLYGQKEAVE